MCMHLQDHQSIVLPPKPTLVLDNIRNNIAECGVIHNQYIVVALDLTMDAKTSITYV